MSTDTKAKKPKQFPDGTKDIVRVIKALRKLDASFERSAAERPNAATIAVKRMLIQDLEGLLEGTKAKYGALGYDRAIQVALPIIEVDIENQLVANAERKAKMKERKAKGPKEGPKKAVGKKH